jgi:holo-[acyl-carrier protein] synthase
MMNIVTGIDLIEIERLQSAIERHGSPFLDRIFTPDELTEARDKPASLAARFAVKEAVAKALGTGIGPVHWKEIESLRGNAGQPVLRLNGKAARVAKERNLSTWSISLSHTKTHAVAVAVAIGSD